MPKPKEYFRIDPIEMEFVNCPDGVRLLSKCEKCFLFKGIEKMYPRSFIRCDYNIQLEEIERKKNAKNKH